MDLSSKLKHLGMYFLESSIELDQLLTKQQDSSVYENYLKNLTKNLNVNRQEIKDIVKSCPIKD